MDSPYTASTANVQPYEIKDVAVQRFLSALRIQTISNEDGISAEPLLQLHRLFISSFPVLHNSSLVTREVINNYSLLYEIQGSEPSLKPYFLTAHLDVVPADPAKWDVPPFEGKVLDGFIYGRGTVDNKDAVMAIFEAVEDLLSHGFRPRRTIYLGFGCDEEIQGIRGARQIAKVLHGRNINFSFLLDEGLMITEDVVTMVQKPVALIGVGEKGFATFRLSVTGAYGHSSIPPRSTTIGILSKAITRLEDNPHKNLFGYGVEWNMLEQFASYASFLYKLVFSNLWLFSPIVSEVMSRNQLLNPIVRTTTAVTVINGGIKANVIPASASAIVNHRIHPVQTVQEILEYDKNVINDDRVSIEVLDNNNPSPLSPYTDSTFGYNVIRTSIHQIFPDAIVGPGVLMAATDCKWYVNLTDQIYRFSPVVIKPTDIARYHGDNERISVESFGKVINFYRHVIVNADRSEEELVPKRKTEL